MLNDASSWFHLLVPPLSCILGLHFPLSFPAHHPLINWPISSSVSPVCPSSPLYLYCYVHCSFVKSWLPLLCLKLVFSYCSGIFDLDCVTCFWISAVCPWPLPVWCTPLDCPILCSEFVFAALLVSGLEFMTAYLCWLTCVDKLLQMDPSASASSSQYVSCDHWHIECW